MKNIIFIFISISALLSTGCGTVNREASSYFNSTQLTETVHVIFGPNQLPNPVNKGFMNNPGS